jgi:hypothetical protein
MLAMLVGFCVSMFMIPNDQAFRITGFTIIGISCLYSTYLNIRIIIVAFYESMVCGLLYLFLPFYPLYFIFTRWSQVGGYFLLQIAAALVAGIGAGVVAMSPMMAEKEGADTVRLPAVPQTQVVHVAQLPDSFPTFAWGADPGARCTQGEPATVTLST